MYFINLRTQTEKTRTAFRLLKMYLHVNVYTVNNKSIGAMIVFAKLGAACTVSVIYIQDDKGIFQATCCFLRQSWVLVEMTGYCPRFSQGKRHTPRQITHPCAVL